MFLKRKWEKIQPFKEVEERYGHSTTLYKNKLYIFGGLYEQNSSPLNEEFINFDLVTKDFYTQEKNNPFPRLRHTAICYRDSLYIFGGCTSTQFCGDKFHNSIIQYHITKQQWNVITPKSKYVPKERFKHSSVLIDHYIYIFGGFSVQNETCQTFFNDIWRFNILTEEWDVIIPKNDIYERMGHAATSKGNKMYIFGGKDAINRFQDLQEFCFENKVWKELPSNGGDDPERRSSGTLNSYKSKLYLFGGFNGEFDISDLHEYNLEYQVWRKINLNNTIPGRSFHTSTLINNQINPYLIVFGGIYEDFNENRVYNDMYKIELENNKMIENIVKSNDYLDVLIITQ